MKPFGVCVFAVLLCGALTAPEASEKWTSFRAKHGKSFAAHEEKARMSRFLDKEAEIEKHNARFAAGEESFSVKHSFYSDLSREEFRQQALGFVMCRNSSEIPRGSLNAMPSRPAEFDWRTQGIMTPVKHQRNCGSCYAFAGAGALEAHIKWKMGVELDLSEQDVVDCSYHGFMGGEQNDGCQGGWPTAVFDYYNQKDVVYEAQYPYTSGMTNQHGTCRIPGTIQIVVQNRLDVQNVMPDNEDQIADYLISKGPLVLAIAADNEYKNFFDGLAGGVFDKDEAIGLDPNHAVVLVGYGTQDGKDYWLIKNSWGADWAEHGYGKIARGKNMCGLMSAGVFFVESPLDQYPTL